MLIHVGLEVDQKVRNPTPKVIKDEGWQTVLKGTAILLITSHFLHFSYSKVIRDEGWQTVLKGTTATVFRRGVDCALRSRKAATAAVYGPVRQ